MYLVPAYGSVSLVLYSPNIQLVELKAKKHAKIIPPSRDPLHQPKLLFLSLLILPLEEVE